MSIIERAHQDLEQAGLVEECTGRARNRQYLARAVLQAIEFPADY